MSLLPGSWVPPSWSDDPEAPDPFMAWATGTPPAAPAAPGSADPTGQPVVQPDAATYDAAFPPDSLKVGGGAAPDMAAMMPATPGPAHYDFTEAEANPPKPLDPYPPYKIGRPHNISADGPDPDLRDPYALGLPVGPDEATAAAQIRAAEGVPFARASKPVLPSKPILPDPTMGADKAATAEDVAKLAKSETLTDNTVATQDELDAKAFEDRVQSLARDPEMLARTEAERRAAIESERLKRETEANQRDVALMEEHAKRRAEAVARAQQTRAKIEQEATAMADSAPFERYWATRSGAQKAAGYIAAIFGGLMMPKTGGRNQALDGLIKEAEDNATQQWKSLQMRRENAGEMMADAEQDFVTQEALRRASREQVARAIETEMAGYDPRGKQAIEAAKIVYAIRAENEAATAAAMKAKLDEAERALKIDMEQQKVDIDAFRAETDRMGKMRVAGGGSGAGRQAGVFGDKAVHTVAEWTVLFPDLKKHLDDRFEPSASLTGQDIQDLLGITGKLGNQSAEGSRDAKIKQEMSITSGKLRVYDPRDPSRVIGEAKDEKAAEVVNEVLAPSVQAVETIDRLIRVADASGGSSDLIKNSDWQMVTGDKAYLDNLIRVSERMGALDAGSQDLIGKMRGGVDPNSFIRDAAPGLRALKENIIRKARLTMNQAGLDGNSYKFPDTSRPPAAPKNEDLSRLMKRNRDGLDFGGARLDGRVTLSANPNSKEWTGLSDDNAAGLGALNADLERGGDVAARAAAAMVTAGRSAANLNARTAAAWSLWKAASSGNKAAQDAIAGLSQKEKADLIHNLPDDEPSKFIRSLFPKAKDD